MRTLASLAWALALTTLAACSAIVSPDPSRLAGDASVRDDVSLVPGGTCPSPLVSCGSRCIDLSSDPASCGACGRGCAAGQACISGSCACRSGDPTCGPTGGLTDPTACGSASVRCRNDQLCIDGACRCRPPLSSSGDACVDLASDPANCGMPGVRCGGGVCAAGHCVGGCPDGTRECDGACVDLRRDPLHCGECGRACRATEACEDGDCRDVEIATGCTSCPCDACRGNVCCVLPRYDVPYCLDADRCP